MAEPRSASGRRKYVRQKVTLPILVEAISLDASKFFRIMGRTRDVSCKGLYFWCPVPPQHGQLLHLMLDVLAEPIRKSKLRIHWEAEVIRVDPGKTGQEMAGVGARILRFDIPKSPYPPFE